MTKDSYHGVFYVLTLAHSRVKSIVFHLQSQHPGCFVEASNYDGLTDFEVDRNSKHSDLVTDKHFLSAFGLAFYPQIPHGSIRQFCKNILSVFGETLWRSVAQKTGGTGIDTTSNRSGMPALNLYLGSPETGYLFFEDHLDSGLVRRWMNCGSPTRVAYNPGSKFFIFIQSYHSQGTTCHFSPFQNYYPNV